MIRIMFVCHGNICRSPMAEFVLKDLVKKNGISDLFYIESAATSFEEIGNPVHPGTRRKLSEVGISVKGKLAQKLIASDYQKFDYFAGMDGYNIRNMNRLFGGDPEGKVVKLLQFAGDDSDIADPWYTGNFDVTYDDVLRGCQGIIKMFKEDKL
ncbi:MAG TPA: low molecular weight phosphotyrosine protein phosphatase [Candidatus Monoglobus merdigallinarum]|uniref:protein-tyrosine-phosphatase n=1 Tax=Candidatus Monoglobus merdigallinarum TaxID=2838698 RepID=A0A9D1TLA8_9FIRM|nr:low molecular weight phosphotyrosine protein phosphatase [Candidatus Monoglobus merdigallinarum]